MDASYNIKLFRKYNTKFVQGEFLIYTSSAFLLFLKKMNGCLLFIFIYALIICVFMGLEKIKYIVQINEKL